MVGKSGDVSTKRMSINNSEVINVRREFWKIDYTALVPRGWMFIEVLLHLPWGWRRRSVVLSGLKKKRISVDGFVLIKQLVWSGWQIDIWKKKKKVSRQLITKPKGAIKNHFSSKSICMQTRPQTLKKKTKSSKCFWQPETFSCVNNSTLPFLIISQFSDKVTRNEWDN